MLQTHPKPTALAFIHLFSADLSKERANTREPLYAYVLRLAIINLAQKWCTECTKQRRLGL